MLPVIHGAEPEPAFTIHGPVIQPIGGTLRLDFAQQRYRVGAGDQRAVQQQSLALGAARTALLRVQAERLVQRVNLYLALGGSFEARK